MVICNPESEELNKYYEKNSVLPCWKNHREHRALTTCQQTGDIWKIT